MKDREDCIRYCSRHGFCRQRIAWLGGEDANGNKILDKGEDILVNGKLDIPHAPDYQDNAWIQTDSGSICTRG